MNFIIKQQVSNCDFPCTPNGQAAIALSLQYQLKHSQWWSEEKMRDFQFLQLSKLLIHSHKTVPYYQKQFKSIGFNPADKVDQYIFENLPILTRKELQNNPKDIISTCPPLEHGKTHMVSTSGSTGRPVVTQTTELAALMWRTFTLREHYWFDRDLTKKLAAIRYAPHGQGEDISGIKSPTWGKSTDVIFETGVSSFLNSNVNISQQAKWLIKENPEYLMSHPSNIMALAEYFIQHKLSVPNLEEVRAHGEPVTQELREATMNAWGTPLTDMYTTVELGYLALQCPLHNHYHIQSEGAIVEILNKYNNPCGPGEIGKVIVTPLHNFASPLIRYDVGDYAEVGEKCSCGRGLPVIKRVLGRVRNMVKLPNGEQLWPEFGFADFADITKIKQVQLIQLNYQQIEAKIVTNTSPLTIEQEKRLIKLWQRNFKHSFDINFSYVDNIPRGPSGKFEDFKCNF